MFWSFQNPIRSIRRLSGRAEYTLLPNHYTRRGSGHSQSSSSASENETETEGGSEKGDEGDQAALEIDGMDRRLKRGRMLVIVLLFLLVGVGMYHHIQSTVLGLDAPSLEAEVDVKVEDGIKQEGIDEEYETEPDGGIREVYYDQEDPTHVHLSPLWPLPQSRQLLVRPPRNQDLIRYIKTGELPSSSRHIDINIDIDTDSDADLDSGSDVQVDTDQGATVDIVYLWVNSTDPHFSPAYHTRMSEEELPVDRGQARRWRDNGELKGAVRSSVQSLGEGLRRVHIVSGDYRYRQEIANPMENQNQKRDDRDETDQEGDELELERKQSGEEEGTGTVGQIPEWLDWSAQQDGRSEKVTWHFHSDIFRLPRDRHGRLIDQDEILGAYELVPDPIHIKSEDGNNMDKGQNVTGTEAGIETLEEGGQDGDVGITTEDRLEVAWRDLALPTFNSFAIESRVGWITGLSDNL